MADLASNTKPIGILQLPNEMIARIIRYVSYRASVFLVCKKLNEICGKIIGSSLFIDMETVRIRKIQNHNLTLLTVLVE